MKKIKKEIVKGLGLTALGVLGSTSSLVLADEVNSMTEISPYEISSSEPLVDLQDVNNDSVSYSETVDNNQDEIEFSSESELSLEETSIESETQILDEGDTTTLSDTLATDDVEPSSLSGSVSDELQASLFSMAMTDEVEDNTIKDSEEDSSTVIARMLTTSLAATGNSSSNIEAKAVTVGDQGEQTQYIAVISEQADLDNYVSLTGTDLYLDVLEFKNTVDVVFPAGTYTIHGQNNWLLYPEYGGNIDLSGAVFLLGAESLKDKRYGLLKVSVQGEQQNRVVSGGTFIGVQTIVDNEDGTVSSGRPWGDFNTKLINAQNITFDGMKFYNAQGLGSHIFDVMGSENVVISNSEFLGYIGNMSEEQRQKLYEQDNHNIYSEAIQIDHATLSGAGWKVQNSSSNTDYTRFIRDKENGDWQKALFTVEDFTGKPTTNIVIDNNTFAPYHGLDSTGQQVDSVGSQSIGSHSINQWTGITITNNTFDSTNYATTKQTDRLMYPIHFNFGEMDYKTLTGKNYNGQDFQGMFGYNEENSETMKKLLEGIVIEGNTFTNLPDYKYLSGSSGSAFIGYYDNKLGYVENPPIAEDATIFEEENISDTTYYVETNDEPDRIIFNNNLSGAYYNYIIVESNGKYGLVDVGSQGSSHKTANINKVEEDLFAKFDELGIEGFEFIILTHHDVDHIRSITEGTLLDKFSVKKVITKTYPEGKQSAGVSLAAYQKVVAKLEEKGIPYGLEEEEFELGDFKIKIVNNTETQSEEVQSATRQTNARKSIAESLTYGTTTQTNLESLGVYIEKNGYNTLIMGDIEYYDEPTVVEQVKDLLDSDGVDVYGAAHHSLPTSNEVKTLTALSPQVIVSTSGDQSKSPDPSRVEMSERLQAYSDDVYWGSGGFTTVDFSDTANGISVTQGTKTTTIDNDIDVRKDSSKSVNVLYEKERTTIPYQTEYVSDDSVTAGEFVTTREGKDGYAIDGVTVEEPITQIIRVGTKPIETITAINYSTQYIANSSKDYGEETIVQEGASGQTITKTLYILNSETGEVSAETESSVVQPIPQIIEKGTKPSEKIESVARGNDIIEDSSILVGDDFVIEGEDGKRIIETTYQLNTITGEITEVVNITETTPINDKTFVGVANPIKYLTKYIGDETLPFGTRIVEQLGKDGSVHINGTMIIEPVAEVIRIGLEKQAVIVEESHTIEPNRSNSDYIESAELPIGTEKVMELPIQPQITQVTEYILDEETGVVTPVSQVSKEGEVRGIVYVGIGENKVIPFSTQHIDDNNLIIGERVVVQEGIDRVINVLNEVVVEGQDEIVLVGTKEKVESVVENFQKFESDKIEEVSVNNEITFTDESSTGQQVSESEYIQNETVVKNSELLNNSVLPKTSSDNKNLLNQLGLGLLSLGLLLRKKVSKNK